MGSGQGKELKELWVVVEEATKSVEESWKVTFVDAFVYQARKRMHDRSFSDVGNCSFAFLMSIC